MRSVTRHAQLFIANCSAAIPEQLLRPNLVIAKVFTGPQKTAKVFQAANGGTLFLDEIGELPSMQSKTAARHSRTLGASCAGAMK
jgi:transcriptional regulator with PAS, ATPase and Fis domain